MKGDVSRPGPSRCGSRCRAIASQLSRGGVQSIDHDLVQPQVGNQGETTGRVQGDAVCVGALLPLSIDAGARVLDERGNLAESAVGLDGQAGHAAAGVIGHQHELAARVNHQVARPGAPRWSLIQERQATGLRIDRQGTYGAGFLAVAVLHFAHCIEQRATRMEGQEGGVGEFGGQTGQLQLAVGEVQAAEVDALAVSASVGAHVDQQLAGAGGRWFRIGCLRSGRGARQRHANDKGRENAILPRSRHEYGSFIMAC